MSSSSVRQLQDLLQEIRQWLHGVVTRNPFSRVLNSHTDQSRIDRYRAELLALISSLGILMQRTEQASVRVEQFRQLASEDSEHQHPLLALVDDGDDEDDSAGRFPATPSEQNEGLFVFLSE
jgi:hypothetical protein